jgi:predicted DNA-binding transcriptional regulator YafY
VSSLPFNPPPRQQPLLPGNAPAAQQFARLLDALVVLDAERACRVADLAARVGLEPERLRALISAFMVAGAEALGPDAPFNVSWGTDERVLDSDEDDDSLHARADVVHLAGSRERGEWLVGDLGRRPVMVTDVARALLAATVMLQSDTLTPERRVTLDSLVEKLSTAMRATVDAPAEATATALQSAVRDRTRVAFRYLHPWTGQSSTCEVEPYDVRRRRDRLVLDAGTPISTYDVTGVSELEIVSDPDAFSPRDLPPREQRTPTVQVVLTVDGHSRQEDWLLGGWGGRVLGPTGDGRVRVALDLDGDAADPGIAERLGVLLLQLGPTCRVEEPVDLQTAARSVGARLLERHSP